MLIANGERFVDEGADFRNYTYAKYGAVILRQPGQFAWQIFDRKVTHLLRDEYRIRQVTKVTANTLEELVSKLDDVNATAALDTIRSYNLAVRTDIAFDPNVRDGRRTEGLPVPKSNWANTIDQPPFEAYAVSCGITFTFGGLRITNGAQVVDTDGSPIPTLRRRRAGRRVVLFQLSRRHPSDVRGGVRPHCRGQRGPRRQRRVTAMEEAFDVVVVGGGGSGLAAALEARTAGARVARLEKNEKLGGSTAWSIGSISATGTPHQFRHGIHDRRKITMRTCPVRGPAGGRDNDKLRRILCDEVPGAFRWLLALGVRFYGPMPEPPHRQPRMHNVLPNSLSYIYHLGRHARSVGVEIRLGTRATALITEGCRVSGVACEDVTFHARRGAFSQRRLHQRPRAQIALHGAQEAKGRRRQRDCHRRWPEARAAARRPDHQWRSRAGAGVRFIPPARTTLVRRLPPWRGRARWNGRWITFRRHCCAVHHGFSHDGPGAFLSLFQHGALLVNRDGRRFCDELDRPAMAARSAGQVRLHPHRCRLARFSAWPHFVSTAPGVAYAYVPDYRRRPDVCTEGSSLGEVAQARDGPAALQAAIAEPISQRVGHARTSQRAALRGSGSGAFGVRPQRRRLGGRRIAPCAGRARSADPWSLCGRRYRSGRVAVERPRPPPGLGVCVGTPRGAICRAGGNRCAA